jgi:hypothetical protein
MNTVSVPVASAWASKINWTQAVALLASVLVLFGINLDPATQVSIIAAIQAIQAVVTWVLKTFFTTTITASSAAKVSP